MRKKAVNIKKYLSELEAKTIKKLLVLEGKNSSELAIVKDKKDHIYYLTIIDGTRKDQKKLLKRAIKELKKMMDFDMPIFDELYDMTSLVSAESLPELASKMLIIEKII